MSGPATRARPSISLAHAPPFRLVAAYFLTAALCAAAGGVLVATGFGDPRNPLEVGTLAVMHLWLVGWLSLTAVGVLVQFLPVTSGVSLLSPRLAWIHLGLHATGLAGIVGAFLSGLESRLAPIAGAVLWSGLVLTAINLGMTLWRSRARNVWRTGALLALSHLIVTPTVGWLLLTFLGTAFVARHHVALLVAHAHLGLVGWLFGLVVAVGGRLLPMFLAAPEPKPWQVGTALALIQTGLGALALAVPFPALASVAVTLLALALCWWVGVMTVSFCHRKKTSPDAPLATAWSGLGLLALVAAAAVVAHGRPGLDGWGTYGLLALAAGSLMTTGLLYRIVPFLVRLDRFRRLPGNPAVPALDQFLGTIPFRSQLGILATGFACAVVDSVLPMRAVNLTGRLMIAVGTVGLAYNLASLLLGPPRWRRLFVRPRVEPAGPESQTDLSED